MTTADRPIGEFLSAVASEAVTPSGGAVAAVAGAAGAALCEMACLHTVGTEEDGDPEADLVEAGEEFAACRRRLLALADGDAAAVDRVQAAFDAPDSGEDPQAAARVAAEVPRETAETCLDVLDAAEAVAAEGNQNAVADTATGAFLADAALRASVFTVRANLGTIDDAAFVSETTERIDGIERAADARLQRVRSTATERL